MQVPHCHVWILRTISGSQMCLQLLQNAQIIKQTDVLLWKSKENMDLSRIYLAVNEYSAVASRFSTQFLFHRELTNFYFSIAGFEDLGER